MSDRPATLRDRCVAVELLIVDVDGVLTDGGIVYASPEAELKHFHVRDGAALRWWQQQGKRAGLITGRRSPLVDVRAAEVGIGMVVQGAADKGSAYRRLLEQAGLTPDRVCYVGDD